VLPAAAAASPTAVEATTGALCVLRYHEIDRLAHDPRMIGVGLTWFDLMGIQGPLRNWYGALMFTNEGDTHARLRRLVSRAFTPRSVARLRAHTASTVEALFEPLDAEGGGDLVERFGRLAIRVMCRLLGVPEEDVAVFGDWADALSPVFGFMDPDQITLAESSLAGLVEYVDALVQRRQRDRGDDLISALLAVEDGADRLARHEVVTMVANLLVGGHDTTSSQIGCSLFTLLCHPDAAARLGRDSSLLGGAVSETLRYEPSIGLIPRTVAEPLEIGGITRPAGTLVLLSTVSGNRDPAVWDDPDRFDVERFNSPSAPRLLSFGSGPHYCLGASLARMTVEETVRGLAGRDVALVDGADAVTWRRVLGRSPAELKVKLGSPVTRERPG
jgi:cytochrome P450